MPDAAVPVQMLLKASRLRERLVAVLEAALVGFLASVRPHVRLEAVKALEHFVARAPTHLEKTRDQSLRPSLQFWVVECLYLIENKILVSRQKS